MRERANRWAARATPKMIDYRSPVYRAWRRAVLAAHPTCADCGSGPQPGDQADHEPPVRELLRRGLDPYDPVYGVRRCRSDHARKSQRERWGRPTIPRHVWPGDQWRPAVRGDAGKKLFAGESAMDRAGKVDRAKRPRSMSQ